eukprot:TRINITY_DN14885_c0_g1_i1.p1 TRINITY_DN14885_c0_g1~~TRINITY_DN14885_c0_g1_i1.p1  ORF type:complete len:870 (+),score=131.41 TRINITY_DN14885_c0_g1_i1:22-2631(+)
MLSALRGSWRPFRPPTAGHVSWHASRATFATTSVQDQELPSHCNVLILGGGVIGCSVAYHLAKLGVKDVVLLEQHRLTSGTTWHAAGLVGTLRPNSTQTKLSLEGTKLYGTLAAETGIETGWKNCGSLSVARTADRLVALRRVAARALAFGIPAEIVSPEECGRLWSKDGCELMETKGLAGGLWLPRDGSVSPTDLAMSLAAGARKRGVRIIENVRVANITASTGDNGLRRATGVQLTGSDKAITADKVVLCGGQWSRDIAARVGANVPLHSTEHYYVITKPIPGAHTMLPVLRDLDALVYMREWSGGLCVGGFELKATPLWTERVPEDFAFSLLPDNWEQFQPLFEGAMERIPALAQAEIRQFVNGPESFTTDTSYILGETPEIRGLFVACGFNSSGIASSGGAGKALAEWIVHGEPTMDLWSVDVRRFGAFAANRPFLRDRIAETLGHHYIMPWPRREFASARNLRRTPLFERLSRANAVFGQKHGWERVSYFSSVVPPPLAEADFTFSKPRWLADVIREAKATREAVAIFDQSSFGKFMVQGAGATAFMQELCAANVDVPIGKLVYTGMLNSKGGYELDVTVTRLAQDKYYIISSTATTTRDMDWLQRNILPGEFVVVTDVTSSYCVLGVMGPKSRELFQRVSTADFSNEGFPFGWSRTVDIGYELVDAKRVTYVGELGWELHVPQECVQSVYDTLMEAGTPLGLTNAGYYAIDCLRIEKGYRAWGHELAPDVTPLEAGLAFAVDFQKPCGFSGKEALLQQKAAGPLRRRVATIILEPIPTEQGGFIPWGDEVVLRNGQPVGLCSSAGWSVTLDRPVCLALLSHPEISAKNFFSEGKWEVEVSGVRTAARVQLAPAYDPKGLRIRA